MLQGHCILSKILRYNEKYKEELLQPVRHLIV